MRFKYLLNFCLVAAATLSSRIAAEEPRPIVLAEGGSTPYTIVVPDDPTAVEMTAARELQSYLAQSTGATWPVESESEAADRKPHLWIGDCRRTAELLPDVKAEGLGDDAIVLRTVGRDLVLTGAASRGPLYAVYTFLEDEVGCRWWTSTERFIPRRERLTIPPLEVAYQPKLVYREAFYRDLFDGVFAARSKCNGHHHRIAEEYGGHQQFAGFVHTFYRILPPERYFAEHPQWYSEIDGRRTHERGQLCLTNTAMREEFIRNCLAKLRATPQARFLSVSQNDWRGACQCEACRAIAEAEGSEAGPLLHFVNAVAEAVEEEFPDIYVETLAYQYTRKPPQKVRPRKNVVIRLCSIECSFVQPLAQGDHNRAFRADIEGWRDVAPRLFIWDYVTNFSNYMVPHPNLRVLEPNIEYFVDNGAIGMFEQGDAQSGVGDFVRLRAWVIVHLMWDPTRDAQQLIDEFLHGYYGPAAPHLAAYLRLIHDRASSSGVYFRCFMPDTTAWLALEDLNDATRLFDQAQAAVAHDPVLRERVRRERLVLDHVWLRRYYALRRAATLENRPFLGPEDPRAACDAFIELCERHKVGNWRERAPFTEYGRALRERFGEPATLPEAFRSLPSTDRIDLQEFDFRLARPGQWAEIVTDRAASNQRAVRMQGDHNQWAVQATLRDDFAAGQTPWRCLVYARCEASTDSGPALRAGIYDVRERKGVISKPVDVAQCSGDYVAIDLGQHVLRPGYNFYVAPPKRPGEVEAVYVDRVLLLRNR